ncbi:hypothetical protein C8Q80DRAFT_1144724 [Daedaleopsis nitida]|nr:hypothetical protein C8Q80DRAFT_1144724 [Daedaleopsis nitida]
MDTAHAFEDVIADFDHEDHDMMGEDVAIRWLKRLLPSMVLEPQNRNPRMERDIDRVLEVIAISADDDVIQDTTRAYIAEHEQRVRQLTSRVREALDAVKLATNEKVRADKQARFDGLKRNRQEAVRMYEDTKAALLGRVMNFGRLTVAEGNNAQLQSFGVPQQAAGPESPPRSTSNGDLVIGRLKGRLQDTDVGKGAVELRRERKDNVMANDTGEQRSLRPRVSTRSHDDTYEEASEQDDLVATHAKPDRRLRSNRPVLVFDVGCDLCVAQDIVCTRDTPSHVRCKSCTASRTACFYGRVNRYGEIKSTSTSYPPSPSEHYNGTPLIEATTVGKKPVAKYNGGGFSFRWGLSDEERRLVEGFCQMAIPRLRGVKIARQDLLIPALVGFEPCTGPAATVFRFPPMESYVAAERYVREQVMSRSSATFRAVKRKSDDDELDSPPGKRGRYERQGRAPSPTDGDGDDSDWKGMSVAVPGSPAAR